MIKDVSTSRFIAKRYNIKFFIRIFVGLLVAHIIGQQFQQSHAAPNKHRLQKTTISNGENTNLLLIRWNRMGICDFSFI
jgi:hypothetical protein